MNEPAHLTSGHQRLSKKALASSYLATGFVLGIVVIGMEINLVDFAALCGCSTEQASVALLWRSFGSMFGSACSGPLMLRFHPHRLAFLLMAIVGSLLYRTPSMTTLKTLNASFFAFGILVSVINTAVLFLLRKVFGKEAGIWLQGLSVTFQLGVMTVPALGRFFGLQIQYLILAGAAFFTTFAGILLPAPKLQDSQNVQTESFPQKPRSKMFSRADVLAACSNFFLVGIIVQTMTYLSTYMTEMKLRTKVNPKDALLGISTSVLLGQLFSAATQGGLSAEAVFNYLACCHLSALGVLATYLALAPTVHAVRSFWVCGIMLFGFLWGPMIGYVYDLWNRKTSASALGTALVSFGGAAGSGLFSFWTFVIWQKMKRPAIFYLSNMSAFVASLIFVLLLNSPKDIEKNANTLKS